MGLQGETVKQYLDIDMYSGLPNLSLARLIYDQNKPLFKDVEAVRDSIRHQKGKKGGFSLGKLVDKNHVQKEDNPYNPFDALPDGIKDYGEWEPYIIDGENILIISDTHIPYHDKNSLSIALNYGREREIDTLFIMGDWMDFYSESKFEKDPRKRDIAHEIEKSVEILEIIRDVFPDIKIILKKGNHDERHERYLKVKAPELLSMKILDFSQLINHGTDQDNRYNFKIDVVGDRRICKIGGLNCVHAHEFGRSISSPVNPARGLFLRGNENAICGHFHRSSDHTETSMAGEVTVCWSIGCLCDLHPEYLPINKWNHGFAIVERDGEKFHVFNRRIIDGKVY